MRYGLPFMGSKSKLAEKIVAVLPRATHLYDVFAGGCAISHAALLSGKWECVHFSDISNSVELFRDCLEGNIPDGSEWISREEFFRRREEPHIRLLWSFGNDGRTYLYSKEIEPYKKAVHEMIFAPTPTERRLKFREVCKLIPYVLSLKENGGGECCATTHQWSGQRGCVPPSAPRSTITPPHKQLSARGLQAIAGFQSNEAHQRCCTVSNQWKEFVGGGKSIELNRLQHEERRWACPTPFCGGEYEMRVADYRDIEILPDSVIYADKPYLRTEGYGDTRDDDFDHEVFYDWAERQEVPVFISEYEMPSDRFKVIAEWDRVSTFSATNNALRKKERLYVPNKWYEKFRPIEQKSLFDDDDTI